LVKCFQLNLLFDKQIILISYCRQVERKPTSDSCVAGTCAGQDLLSVIESRIAMYSSAEQVTVAKVAFYLSFVIEAKHKFLDFMCLSFE
jgi:hypothetical protein